MRRALFERNAIAAGVILLIQAGSPIFAATGIAAPAAVAVRPGHTCPDSTELIVQLAMIETPGDRDFQCLGVSLDADTVKAIRLETHHFTAADQLTGQEQVKIEEFARAAVESSRGVVVDGVPGHDAIVLRGHFVTPAGKADLVTSYLYNGFTGTYRSCLITFDEVPGTGWHLFSRLEQTVTHIMVRTRQMPLIGAFGIADLEGACD
jgi:hypothetical protein